MLDSVQIEHRSRRVSNDDQRALIIILLSTRFEKNRKFSVQLRVVAGDDIYLLMSKQCVSDLCFTNPFLN